MPTIRNRKGENEEELWFFAGLSEACQWRSSQALPLLLYPLILLSLTSTTRTLTGPPRPPLLRYSLPLGVKFQFPLCIWISRELMKRENKIGFVISCFVLLVWIVELMFEK